MQDFGVNLICVEKGIDSSKDAGKLMISVLSAVAEKLWLQAQDHNPGHHCEYKKQINEEILDVSVVR